MPNVNTQIFKSIRWGIVIFCLLGAALCGADSPPPTSTVTVARTVYILPVSNVIDRAQLYVFRRGLAEAQQHQAAALILDMDTPGGRIDITEEILKLLKQVSIPTYTYVNPSAISAGAIIALGTRHIYMAPGSRIGDAMPIMLSPVGGVEALPPPVEEKMVSYVSALIRSAAQENGHDPALAEAMVRRDIGYRFDDKTFCATGHILTLTSQDAAQLVGPEQRPLLSQGTVSSLDELIKRIGVGDARRIELRVTAAEKLARWIETLSILLLAGGLLGLYIEFKTPGFGLPGILGILLLAIWFWGHHVAGLAGMEDVILFVLGVALLAVEIFILPGFGMVGFLGILLILISLVMGLTPHFPGSPLIPEFADVSKAFQQVALALIASLVGLLALGRFLPKTRLFHQLVLDTELTDSAAPTLSARPFDLIGRQAQTLTHLNPSGFILLDDNRVAAASEGDFIASGQTVVITSATSHRIIVTPFNPKT
jgi:membrane-bound serine protease (ClpP class)